jgi:DNA-binding transcriptional MocR family regulator
VSRTTAALAIEALIAEGYVVARPRSGMFVADDPRIARPPGQPSGGGARSPMRLSPGDRRDPIICDPCRIQRGAGAPAAGAPAGHAGSWRSS